MLSRFPPVVVVGGGSKQAVHVIVWGGMANEGLTSVSKRTTRLKPNPPQSYNDTVIVRMLDHTVVATRMPTGAAKGQDQRREKEACLMMTHGSRGPQSPPPPHDTGTIEIDPHNKTLYLCMALLVILSVMPHTRPGLRDTK